MLDSELWAPVGCLSHMLVSNRGNVFNGNRLKSPYIYDDDRGYLCFLETINGKRTKYKIHRLVAQLFIPNPENKPIVDHIDGNKHNNHIDNLRWFTYSENTQAAYDLNLCSKSKKFLTMDERKYILDSCSDLSTKELMGIYGVSKDTILRLRKRGY